MRAGFTTRAGSVTGGLLVLYGWGGGAWGGPRPPGGPRRPPGRRSRTPAAPAERSRAGLPRRGGGRGSRGRGRRARRKVAPSVSTRSRTFRKDSENSCTVANDGGASRHAPDRSGGADEAKRLPGLHFRTRLAAGTGGSP